jgi:DNA polymerase
MLWIDFETRSRCDLISHGVYNYARDASTQVLCLSYAFDDEEVQSWLPHQLFPWQIVDHIIAGGQIRAHNAAFERLIMWYVLCPDQKIPEPKLEQFYCTATQARANCAPGSLEDVGRFSGANMRKDHRGNQLIRLLSIPKSDGTFNDDPTLMAEMVDYCEQDVRAMRAISQAMRQLSDDELIDYHINEQINDRGVLLDKSLAESAIKYASVELEEIEKIVAEVTEGEITSVRSPKMREWVLARVGDEAKKLMEIYKDGEKKYSIDKSVRANLLILAEENPDQVPPQVADVIQCADDLWASSVAKFNRLKELADEEDHRVRGAFVFAGGSATGRASSYGAQVHNFTRKSAKDPDAVRQAMVRGHAIVPAFGKRITDVLKSMLRPALIPDRGKSLVVADWSAVEGRVHPWLSHCKSGEEKLEAFRKGLDPYIVNAAKTFNKPYEVIAEEYEKTGKSDERQVGKVQELALGFLGGAGSFETFGRVYGIKLSDNEIQKAIKTWRQANPWAMEHGQALESSYTRAMRNKGHEFSAGRVTYLFDGQHLWYALPSGRVLCYPFARLEQDGVSYAKAAWKPAADATEWPRASLWRGLACENITQAVANDLLRHSLRGLADVVLHVHDEIVVETSEPEIVVEKMKQVMCTPPAWGEGLPLDIEVSTMTRYGK